MDEFQELIPSLTVTAFFTLALLFVARQEEGYTWWKAVAATFAGQGIAIAFGIGIEALPSVVGRILAWASLPVIAAAVALGCRWMRMSWRDGSVVGASFVIIHFLVSLAGVFVQGT